MAKARDIPRLHDRATFRAAAREAVAIRAQEVFDHADGVLDTGDIERVHAMRVATRRLRAVLEVFAPAFEHHEHKRALKDVKELADALGARRDPDVQLLALKGLAAALPDADQPGLALFAGRIGEEQAAGNRALAAALEHIAADDLQGRLRRLAGEEEGS